MVKQDARYAQDPRDPSTQNQLTELFNRLRLQPRPDLDEKQEEKLVYLYLNDFGIISAPSVSVFLLARQNSLHGSAAESTFYFNSSFDPEHHFETKSKSNVKRCN